MRRPLRLVAFAALTTFALLALVAVVVELGARLVLGDAFVGGPATGRPADAIARFDPDLGWKNAPGVRTEVVAPTFRYQVSINSRGLRDREHPYERPEGVLRVVLLSDSVGWGWGVDDRLAYADLAEEALAPELEIVNLSVPGYSTDQELWLLEHEVSRYDPDLVLLGFVLNDVFGNETTDGYFQDKPQWVRGSTGEWELTNHPVGRSSARTPSAAQWLYAHSAAVQLVTTSDSEEQLARSARTSRASRGARARARPERPRDARDPQAELAAHEAEIQALCDQLVDPEGVTHMLLARMVRACGELGVPLVAFAVPHHHDRYLYVPAFPRPDAVAAARAAGRPYETELTRRLAQAGRQLGFETFSVDQALLSAVDGGVLHCGDGHLNARGNAVVARRVVAELAARVEALRAARARRD